MLEARVEVRLKSELNDDGIMMAVNVGIHSVKSLEDLSDEHWKSLWKRNPLDYMSRTKPTMIGKDFTNPARKHSLVVDVSLNPSH